MDKIIEEAARRADTLSTQIREQGLPKAFVAFDQAIADLERDGLDLDTVLPPETVGRLGAVTPDGERADGRTFWLVYKEVVCESVCKEGSDLNKTAKAAVQGSSAALITGLLSALGLPVAAVGVAITIAAILLALGVDAFCRNRGQAEIADGK